jgi:hypothetical protein
LNFDEKYFKMANWRESEFHTAHGGYNHPEPEFCAGCQRRVEYADRIKW